MKITKDTQTITVELNHGEYAFLREKLKEHGEILSSVRWEDFSSEQEVTFRELNDHQVAQLQELIDKQLLYKVETGGETMKFKNYLSAYHMCCSLFFSEEPYEMTVVRGTDAYGVRDYDGQGPWTY